MPAVAKAADIFSPDIAIQCSDGQGGTDIWEVGEDHIRKNGKDVKAARPHVERTTATWSVEQSQFGASLFPKSVMFVYKYERRSRFLGLGEHPVLSVTKQIWGGRQIEDLGTIEFDCSDAPPKAK